MVLEMVKTQTAFTKQMILEAPWTLRPFKVKIVIFILSLNPVFSPEQNFSDDFMIVTLAKKEETIVERILLDRLKFRIVGKNYFFLDFLGGTLVALNIGGCLC